MNTDDALLTLGDTAADAVLGVLLTLCPDGVEKGHVSVVSAGASPLESVPFPVVATDVSYTEGVNGGNVFTITRLGARRLAAAMMMQEPPTEDGGQDLDEIEMSALGEAMNQMMAASAAALAGALGYPVDISVPSTRVLPDADAAEGVYPQTPYATRVSLTVLGESCRLIQLVPNAFVVRMARAIDDGEAVESAAAEHDSRERDGGGDWGLSSRLRDIPVRVAAELGRATLSLEQVAEPRPGAVIELDRSSEDPIDLCVNGRRFATGRLFLIDQTEWAMRIERVLDVDPAEYVTQTGGT
ncbi:MAG: FliM/FliN family flagellar motor switch protein [Solirubrobacteraceae bacterium]